MQKNSEKKELSEKIRANIMASTNSSINGYIERNSNSKEHHHIPHYGISDKKRSTFSNPTKNPYWPDNLWKDNNLIYSIKQPEKCLGPPNSNKSDKTIRFNSNFESGNLMYAYKLNPDVYHCIIENDHSQTEGCQWFYFQMSNIQTLQNFNRKITFYISGFSKESSVISNGWKVFMYSEKMARSKNISWFRTGTNYAFGKSFKEGLNFDNRNNRRKKQKNSQQINNSKMFTLQFQITFPFDDDIVYLCYGIPYTFTDLNQNIQRWTQSMSSIMTCQTLCKTKIGKDCPLLTITSPNSPKGLKKKCIFLTARNHPSESNGSFILHGLIDFLFSKQQSSEFLLNNFVFKIVPMINVEGVIDGAHHVGIDGENMNKVWSNPDPFKHPVVFHTKNLLAQIEKENGIEVFIDIHGCSSEHGTFLCGCPYTDSDKLPVSCINKEKIFPKILDSLCDSFSLEKCIFPLHRRRNEQPRSVVRKEFHVVNSFTLKSSFGGSTEGIWANSLYSEFNWKEIGAKIGEALFHLLSVENPSYLLKSVENSKTFSNSGSPKSSNSSFDSFHSSPIKMNSKEDILAEMKRKAEADQDATVIAIETENGIKIISGNPHLSEILNQKNEMDSNSRLGYRSESNSNLSSKTSVSSNSEVNSSLNPRIKTIRNTNANYSPNLSLNSRFSSSLNSDSCSKYQSKPASIYSSYLASRTNYSANTPPKQIDDYKSTSQTMSNSIYSSNSNSKPNQSTSSNLFLSSDSSSNANFNSSARSNYNSETKSSFSSSYNTSIQHKLNSNSNSDYKSNQTTKRSESPKIYSNTDSNSDYKSNQASKRSQSPKNSNADSNFSPKKNIYNSNIRTKLDAESNSDAKSNFATNYNSNPRTSMNVTTNSSFDPNQNMASKNNSNIRSKLNTESNTDIKPSLGPRSNSSPRTNYGSNDNTDTKQTNITSRIYSSPKPSTKNESNSDIKQTNVTSKIYSSPKPSTKSESNSESKQTNITSIIYSSPKPSTKYELNSDVKQTNITSRVYSSPKPSMKYESNSDTKPSLLSQFNSNSDTNSSLIQRPNSSLKSSSINRPISRSKLSSENSELQQPENSSFLNANECTSSWSSFQSTTSFPSATSFKSPFTTSNKRVTFQSDIYQTTTPKKKKKRSKDS